MLSQIKHCFSKILRWFHSKTVAANRDESNVDIERHPWTFEVSWDVVDNVADMVTINGDKNILIGPYRVDRVVNKGVVESELPPGTALAMAVHSTREKGIHVVTGKWLVDGKPPAILFDIQSAKNTFDHIERFKKEQGIEIPDNDQETKDAVVFGYMVAEFLTEFEFKRSESDATLIRDETCAVFHDWNCGVALILLHQWQSPIVTVFILKTSQLHGHFECEKRAADEAKALGIYHRLCIERGAASASDIFSCVSETVAEQAELILDKHPDYVILPTVKT